MPDPDRYQNLACPRCGSPELETVPTFDEDDAPTGSVAILCSRCGYHLEDAPAGVVLRREFVEVRS